MFHNLSYFLLSGLLSLLNSIILECWSLISKIRPIFIFLWSLRVSLLLFLITISHSILCRLITDDSRLNPLCINGSFSVIADLLWLVSEHFNLISLNMLRCSALVSLYHYSVNIMKYKLVFLFLTSIHVNAEQIKTVNKISAGIVYLISLSLLLLNHPSHQPILLLNPSFSLTHPSP